MKTMIIFDSLTNILIAINSREVLRMQLHVRCIFKNGLNFKIAQKFCNVTVIELELRLKSVL